MHACETPCTCFLAHLCPPYASYSNTLTELYLSISIHDSGPWRRYPGSGISRRFLSNASGARVCCKQGMYACLHAHVYLHACGPIHLSVFYFMCRSYVFSYGLRVCPCPYSRVRILCPYMPVQARLCACSDGANGMTGQHVPTWSTSFNI